MSSAIATSVISVVSGVSNLFGGGSSGSGNVAGGAYYDPFAQYRTGYANQLQSLMNNPGKVQSLPGYQFGLQQGNQALERNAAASGQLRSGGEQIALQQYNQNYANSYYNNMLSQLSQLSGATQAPLSVVDQNKLNANQQQQGLQNIQAGIGGMKSVFGSDASSTSFNNPVNYDSSGNYTGPGSTIGVQAV